MDIKIASFISLISSGGLYYLISLMNKRGKEIEELNAKKLYTPSSLNSELKQPDFLKTLKRNPENSQEYFMNVFMEGYVDCSNPLISKIDRKTQLVYILSYGTELHANHSVAKLKKEKDEHSELTDLNVSSHFTLKDPFTEESCLVKGNLNVNTNDALERIAERITRKKLTFIENLFVKAGRIMELLNSITRGLLSYKGIKIGFTETEFGIAVGSALTVYGQAIYNSMDGTLRIDTPLHFLQEKASLIHKLKGNIDKLRSIAYFLLVPFALSTLYLVTKGIQHYRSSKIKKEEQEIAMLEKAKFGNLEDEYKCIVCVERPRNLILKPCLHFSLCKICYGYLPKNNCPICKKEITGVIPILFI